MIDLKTVPVAELRERLAQAQQAEQLAAFDDNHASYTRRVDQARAEQLRLLAEINSREAHFEAINGK